MKRSARSVEKMIEEQVKIWEMRKQGKAEPKTARPVVTVSRQPGSEGRQFSKLLADRLSMDFFDREIINQIARNAKISTYVVDTLDEKEQIFVEDWINEIVGKHAFLFDDYLRHLMKVIGTMGNHGNAVILGRGACFILPKDNFFAVRLIAPFSMRAANIVKTKGISIPEAEHWLINAESNQRAFIQKYFNKGVSDPENYDMVINLEKIDVSSAVDSVKKMLES